MKLRLSLLVTLVLTSACPPSGNKNDAGLGAAPKVDSASPASAPQAGGTLITLNGANFEDGAKVKFGTQAGLQVVVLTKLQLSVRTPAFTTAGKVAITVTNPDGQSGSLTDPFTVVPTPDKAIDEAVLSNPANTSDTTGAATVKVPVTASVQVANVTKGAGQGAGIVAKVGFSRTVTSPPVDADFTWVDATYTGDADGPAANDQARDTYSAQVVLPGAMDSAALDYFLAAKFSLDNGTTWKLADRDGLANGLQREQLANYRVAKPTVDWCKLGGETGDGAPSVTLIGTAAGPVVLGQVYKAGVTTMGNPGAGVTGQLGFGPAGSDPSTWTWTNASYSKKTGNGSNEEWTATLPNPGLGTYKYAYRFTQNNGSWQYCDADGLAIDGFTEAKAGTLNVVAPTVGIEWCKLGGEAIETPPSVTLTGSAAGPTVYGQVYKGGITTMSTPGVGITGQLGYGAAGTNPATWTWAAATYSKKTGGGSNEEWSATLPNPGLGSYKYAYRFAQNNGTWSYCDADGLALNGFTEAQAGTLIVAPVAVGSCNLQYPLTLTSYEGRDSDVVYGRLFVTGVTDGVGAGAGVDAELGYGPAGQQPSDAGWTWKSASFNVDIEPGGGDEYQATFLGPAPGTYGYAYRTRVAGGAWAYCDGDGSSNGYTPAQGGVLTAKAYGIDECVLDSATMFTSAPSAMVGPVRAKVRVPTLTDVSGKGAGITAEVGYGAVGTAPSTWTNWSGATYEADSTTFDQYSATFGAPAADGTVELAYRFKLGSGAYVYCDKDGVSGGYMSAQGGRLTVASKRITACKMESVSAFAIRSGDPLAVTVSIEATGSAAVGATAGLGVQVGVGPKGSDGSASALWGWATASYTGEFAGGRDLFSATTQPAYNGDRTVAGRASLDNGVTWTYCDFVGADGGFQPSAQYDVTVSDHTDVAYCVLQHPPTVSGDAGVLVYGQVYDAVLTPDAGAPIRAEFGAGLESQDPGVAWTWHVAAFSGAAGNNNEYAYSYAPGAVGTRYAYRFSKNDGGTWCYADLNGNGASGVGQTWGGFSGGSNLGAVVP